MEFYRKLKKSRLPWYLFYGGLTIELLIVIVDKSNLINPFEGRLFQITFLIFLLKLQLTDYRLGSCSNFSVEATAAVSSTAQWAAAAITIATIATIATAIAIA